MTDLLQSAAHSTEQLSTGSNHDSVQMSEGSPWKEKRGEQLTDAEYASHSCFNICSAGIGHTIGGGGLEHNGEGGGGRRSGRWGGCRYPCIATTPLSCCLRATALWLPLGLEAFVVTPNGVYFLFFFSFIATAATLTAHKADERQRQVTSGKH